MKCHEIKKRLSGLIDGELTAAEEQSIRIHLKACDACCREYDMLNVIVREAHEMPQVQAPATIWDRIEADLDARNRSSVKSRFAQISELLRRAIESPRFGVPAVRFASVAFILLVGFLLGRYLVPMSGDVRITQTDMQPTESTVIQARAVNYIEKSKILFLGIVNADSSDITKLDFSTEKEHARNLIQEASFLKENIPLNKNVRLRSLIEELELILFEIANLEEEQDLEDVELIKSGIDQNGLLLKINLQDLSTKSEISVQPNSNI